MKQHIFRKIGGLVSAGLIIFLTILALSDRSAAQEPIIPTAVPEAEIGLAIFQDRCVVCHGAFGEGNGEQALAAGLEPANFADPNYRLDAEPQVMFDIINNGNLTAGMPPFGAGSTNPLSAAEIWHLVAAVYSYSTPPENLAAGEALFADSGGNAAEIPDLAYWYTRSNATAQEELAQGDWGISVDGLSAPEMEAVIDYGRAQAYNYLNPLAPIEPIAAATVGGLIVNGTTRDPISSGDAILRVFTSQLQETLLLSTTIALDGSFEFNLTDVQPDWIYLVNTDYNGLTFNSNPDRLTREEPALNMPVIVYDSSADDAAVRIEQIHVILNFVPNTIQVSELYLFSNDADAVFVGTAGDNETGTVEISLPAGATNVDFQRAFGSLDNFTPAPEVIETETGYADTVPLRPGSGSTSLLVSYELPYEEGLRLAHPLAYPVSTATAILPDAGVSFIGEGWLNQGPQSMASGSFLAYTNNDLAAATALNIELDGRPRQLFDVEGNSLLIRDNTQELVVGGVAFGLALLGGVLLVRQWQSPKAGSGDKREELLAAIADLDDEYEAGEINSSLYQSQRALMLEELVAIWHQPDQN